MMSRRALAIGAVTLALCGAACSSGGGGTSTATVGPSTASTSTSASSMPAPSTTAASDTLPAKATFLDQGNAICRNMNNAQVAFDQRPENQGDTATMLTAVLNGQADIITTALQQLQALTPPPGDEATIADLLTKVQTFIDVTRHAATTTDGSDSEWSALVDQMDAAAAAANAAANAYGLYECGRDDLSTSTA